MANFLKDYGTWDKRDSEGRKEILVACASFYEEKALDYILAKLPKSKQKDFKKDPIAVEFVETEHNGREITFGDNVVYILESLVDTDDKKKLFFNVGRSTICAVFVNIFYSTASDPGKKTKFGDIANAFFASITAEFGKGQSFENDMMQAYEEILGEALELGVAQTE